jgi:flagella basal body P-ring formation protein FlgA
LKKRLLEKINNKSIVAGVVGLGYVGLPLAVEKAKAGFKTIGFDVQSSKVDMVNNGQNYIGDVVDSELKALVDGIRNIELAKGSFEKIPTQSELKNRTVARKSIVAARAIKCGELLTEENLTTKRPGNGISPMKWNEVMGQKAIRDFVEDEVIEL